MTTHTTSLMNWVSPSAMQAMGWALLHFVWQGMALAAFAAAAMALCRRTQVKYLLGVVTLVMMLLAPAATFVYDLQQNGNSPRIAQGAVVVTPVHATSPSVGVINSASPQNSPVRPSLDSLPWLVEAWLIGVAFFSLRSAGGFLLLERERRRQSSVVEDRNSGDLLFAARSTRDQSRHSVLRVHMAANPSRNRLVSSYCFPPAKRSDRTVGGAVARSDRA